MNEPVRLDEIDYQILNILQERGRITNADLAKEVGLSAPPILERVKKLERSGVIEGYRAILDPGLLGRRFQVFAAVNVETAVLSRMSRFEAAIDAMPEVLECHHIAGNIDFLLKILVADQEAYKNFIADKLSKIPDVKQIHSFVTLSAYKAPSVMEIPEPTKKPQAKRKRTSDRGEK